MGRPRAGLDRRRRVPPVQRHPRQSAHEVGLRRRASRSTRRDTANANGMTRDRQGRLVVCHHFSRCVDREEADGSITVIADRYKGSKLNRPNDVVVKSDGSIYFSDPPPRPPLTPPEHTPELDIAGVYRVSPDLKQDQHGRPRLRQSERTHVLARRKDPVHQRQQSPPQADQGLRRRRQRHARPGQRAPLLRHARRRPPRRAGRHEGRRRRQRVLHRSGRHLGHLARRRAHRHDPDARRQHGLGRRRLDHPVLHRSDDHQSHPTQHSGHSRSERPA